MNALIFPPKVLLTSEIAREWDQSGVMTTSTSNSTGTSFWKVLGIIVAVLIGLAIIGPLLKGLFWLAFVALAVYGGFVLFRRMRSGSSTHL